MDNQISLFGSQDFATVKDYEAKLANMTSMWGVTYQRIAEDFNYVSGQQGAWDPNVLADRDSKDLPSLTLQLMEPYVERYVAPIRTRPPGMVVRTGEKSIEMLINGVLRGIERASNSAHAYSQAAECQTIGGMGWLYIAVEEEHGKPVLRIKSTDDPTQIYIDPLSQYIDGRDAKYGCFRGYMDRDAAIMAHGPEAGERAIGNDSILQYNLPSNATTDVIWYTITEDGMRIQRVIGAKIVYNQEFKGVEYLPLVPVYGQKLYGRDGRRYGGLVRRGRDINSAINLTASNVMVLVSATPKSPWIADPKAIKGYEDVWATAATEVHSYLPARSVDPDTNQPLEKPFRADNTPQTQALVATADWFNNILGTVVGVNEAMMGGLESANESGRSLIARMEAAEFSTAKYLDNLTSSITQLARVMIQMIPVVYAGKRSIVVIDDFGRSARVNVDMTEIMTEGVIDMLDCEIESGPAMEMRRKSAAISLQQIITAAGDKGLALLDLWAETQDLPNANAVLDRIRKILPPELTQQEGGMDPQSEEALKAAEEALNQKEQTIAQLQGMIGQLQAQVASLGTMAEVELQKAQINMEKELQKQALVGKQQIDLELLKQSGADQQLAAKLTAEQQKQVNSLISELVLKNASVVENVNNVVQPEAPKLPEYLSENIFKPNDIQDAGM